MYSNSYLHKYTYMYMHIAVLEEEFFNGKFISWIKAYDKTPSRACVTYTL